MVDQSQFYPFHVLYYIFLLYSSFFLKFYNHYHYYYYYYYYYYYCEKEVPCLSLSILYSDHVFRIIDLFF